MTTAKRAEGCKHGRRVLTTFHLIALLCGGRVAHDGSLMVDSSAPDDFSFEDVDSDSAPLKK